MSFQLRRLWYFDLAIDRLGFYFSADVPSDNDYVVMDAEPQLETSGTILQPDTNWQFIQFYYMADGTENFLTIGNFRWPDEMMVVETGTSPYNAINAYYFFDEVQVQKANTIVNELETFLSIALNQPQLSVRNNSSSDVRCMILDESGRLIQSIDVKAGASDSTSVNNHLFIVMCTNREGEKLVRKFVTR